MHAPMHASTTLNPIKQKATLSRLKIQVWTAHKLDREVTDEVNHAKGAAADASRVNKLLLPKKHLAAIHLATRTARVLWHNKTQPWLDEGYRVLANVLQDDLAQRIGELKADFNGAADFFAKSDYPKYLANRKEAEQHIGKMFKADDYPPVSEIRGRFNFHWSLHAFADTADKDFRTQISADQLADSEAAIREAIDNAMKDPIERIIKVTAKMAERLKGYEPGAREGTFRDSLVGNIRELVDLLPAFNLSNDKNLTELTNRMKKELCVREADLLRDDAKVRKAVTKSAEDILKQAQALMA